MDDTTLREALERLLIELSSAWNRTDGMSSEGAAAYGAGISTAMQLVRSALLRVPPPRPPTKEGDAHYAVLPDVCSASRPEGTVPAHLTTPDSTSGQSEAASTAVAETPTLESLAALGDPRCAPSTESDQRSTAARERAKAIVEAWTMTVPVYKVPGEVALAWLEVAIAGALAEPRAVDPPRESLARRSALEGTARGEDSVADLRKEPNT